MRRQGQEIEGYKKRCTIRELHVVISIFPRSLTLILNVIFVGPLKDNEQCQKWPNCLGSLQWPLSLPFFQSEKKN